MRERERRERGEREERERKHASRKFPECELMRTNSRIKED